MSAVAKLTVKQWWLRNRGTHVTTGFTLISNDVGAVYSALFLPAIFLPWAPVCVCGRSKDNSFDLVVLA